jgi:hypothetical protein
MKTLVPLFVAMTMLVIGAPGAEAQRLNYPYCAVFDFRTTSCAFNTMAQCMATVSGRGGFCEANAWYRPPAKAKRKKKSS